ncbi:type IV secretion protein Rhs [Amycolatopsis rhizosphaerae]|uniref:Type IV secretion protein Rhs n=1 Tax=Amycolatopsis rhizosphaerae TaxID=2053003 RepID=A0A558BDV3_9PSEU|nr:DUF6531 domain-containing protein [Amycolatopsis rhizosphaerae]TVT34678.1 type IV secretion protein Rhs [Amycolatopsis rhizosphaerae]
MKENSGDPQADGRQKQCAPGSGDPVDLTTGQMFMGQTDLELPGVLPLVLRRTHFSDYRVGRWFGRSWASTLDQRIEIEDDAIYFADEDGARLRYPLPGANGHPVLPAAGPRWPLERADDGTYRINRPERNQVLSFQPTQAPVRPVAEITDRNGNRIEFRYDSAGSPVEIVHSGGYRIGVDTADGLVTGLRLLADQNQEQDRDTRTVTDTDIVLKRFRYNERRQLAEVLNSSDRPMLFDYDLAGRITRWQDRNGEWYRYEYDGRGRVVRTEGSGGALTGTWLYDTENRVTVYTDALGNASTYHYNEAYQIVREIDPLGHQVLREWDGYDRLAAVTDALGRVTRYTYDEAGNLTTVTRPDGTQELAEYNEFGLPATVVDPNGAVWRHRYDGRGNRVETIDPLGARTRFGYDERGHLTSVVDAMGNARSLVTNAAGLPIAVTDPLGATTRGSRDQFGRLASVTDELGRVTRFTWTVEGEMLTRTDPGGATEHWRYDGESNRVEHVTADGRVTRMLTTHFDLPAAQIDPDGARTEFRYDRELRLAEVINPVGQVWHYDYDAAGNLVRERDFDGRELVYHYDAAGQLVRRVNGAGEAVDYVRDPRGHVVEQRTSDDTARFEFDAIGRMVRAVNAHADVVFERDLLGRVLAETVNGRTVSSRYDVLGRRVYRRTPTGAESEWSFDARHQPVALRTGGRTVSFGYDPAGRETERLLDTGTILAQSWDIADRMTAQTLSTVAGGRATARPIRRREYRYGPGGLLSAVVDRDGTRSFDLDPAGRVTGVEGPGFTESYAYDRAGNLAASPDVRYGHDAQGRVVLRTRKRLSAKPAVWRYSWNAEDRLTAVITPDGTRWRYLYDALGRRIAKQRLAPDGLLLEQVDFSWDGTAIAEQTHGSGLAVSWNYEPRSYRPATQVERVPDPQGSREWVDSRFYSIVTDLVGTPTELVDPSGNTAWRSATTLWGTALGEVTNTASTPWRFPGQYHDPETGLHYNFQRYYDPVSGRYCSKDPLGLAGGPNPSGYVRNPWHWIDPLGLAESCDPPLPERPESSPAYSVAYEAQLDPAKDFPGRSDKHHFAVGNRQLHAAFESDPAFAKAMNEQYPGIVDNVKPGPRGAFPRTSPHEDLTWHHEANRPGTLQLVPRAHHAGPGPVQGSLHPGGRGGMENWGGGRRR